jgi:hypothetical protein
LLNEGSKITEKLKFEEFKRETQLKLKTSKNCKFKVKVINNAISNIVKLIDI